MLAECYRNIFITYDNHSDISEYAESIKEIKTFMNPLIDSVASRIAKNKILQTTYTFPRLNDHYHIVIYVNPKEYSTPQLALYDSHTKECTRKIPYDLLLNLKKRYIRYEFEEKCLGLDTERFKRIQTPDLTEQIEKTLNKTLELHEYDFVLS